MTTHHHTLKLTEYERVVLQRTLLQALNNPKIKLDLMESLNTEDQPYCPTTNSGYSLIKGIHKELENIKTCYIDGELAKYTGNIQVLNLYSAKPFYEVIMLEGKHIGTIKLTDKGLA